MMRLKVRISGSRVQDIGYRVFLLGEALELGIEKFSAYNKNEKGRQAVVALIDGAEDKIAAFKEFIQDSEPDGADVSETAFFEHKGKVMNILSYSHLLQVQQLSKGIAAIRGIDFKQEKLIETVDRTGKQIAEEIRSTRKDIVDEMRSSRECIVSELRETRHSIITEIKESRTQQDGRLDRIEGDLSQIKSRVGL